MTNAAMQGDEWAAYSTLGRTTATYRGMAYGRRRLAVCRRERRDGVRDRGTAVEVECSARSHV